jgi:ParB/RepB/Spo0J family partition protein
MLIPLDSIDVTEDRYRKDFGDLNSLALSINQFGLIQPIIVEPTEDNRFRLIAGERRFRAHQILKRTEIEALYREELDELRRIQLELEENLHRKDFTWQEEVAIKAKIHELQLAAYGEKKQGRSSGAWTIQDTAAMINESKTVVAGDIELARGIEKYPELAKEKNKTSAFKQLKKLEEQRMREALAQRMRDRGVPQQVHGKVIHGDCTVKLRDLPANSVHLVVTDPPYGIDFQDIVEDEGNHLNFADDKGGSFDTIELMLTELQRVMTPDSGIFMFCSITFTEPLKEMLKKYGFDPDPMPLIWYKSNLGGGRINVPDRDSARVYEAIIYARRGKRALIKQGQPNVLAHEVLHHSKKLHPTEKPTALLRDLITRASIEGEVVLDPCAGSGSTLVAAQQTKREFMGIEREEHFFTVICQRLAKPQPIEEKKAAPTTTGARDASQPKPPPSTPQAELAALLDDLEEEEPADDEPMFGGLNKQAEEDSDIKNTAVSREVEEDDEPS